MPLLRDLATTPEQREILDFMSLSVAVGRPVATTPGAPPDRVTALRKAFDATLNDPPSSRTSRRTGLSCALRMAANSPI